MGEEDLNFEKKYVNVSSLREIVGYRGRIPVEQQFGRAAVLRMRTVGRHSLLEVSDAAQEIDAAKATVAASNPMLCSL
jgi:hypothetical protein